ncbi:MAG TPA: SDR family NAD(P)-dependent oxidoreductase [Candidatus Dormibacteraeota bacterium]|nr:SDR family NAD(P)-dependent oxidoreductase [Candidatus Dormibacteraeota bacterium]
MSGRRRGVAVVTGASSGIGAATVVALARAGWEVVAGARREDRLREVADRAGARWMALDVTDQASVDAFVAGLDECAVLVNNAGGAFGLSPIAEADDDQWRRMYEVNVLGLMRMTRALLPRLERADPGHVVNIGSIASNETYPGGAGYTAVKHAVRAISRTLRQELLGRPVRVTEVDPGAVDTEFSLVRLGSQDRADAVYAGMTPLTAEDIAECVLFAVERPAHVNIDEILVRPIAQVMGTPTVHRRPPD